MGSLRERLVEGAPREVKPSLHAIEPSLLDSSIEALLVRARADNASFELPDPMYVAYVAARLADPPELDRVHAADLYLACGCVAGDPKAVAQFEERFGKEIDRGLSKGTSGIDPDRGQIVRARLFVGGDEVPAKLASYKGQGALLHWLRVTVVRMRVDFARAPDRADAPHKRAPHLSGVVSPQEDPEYRYLRAKYADIVKRAFEGALSGLQPKDRNLLCQHLVDGLSTRQLSGLYNVDHTTVGRWIKKVREELWKDTRRQIMASLEVDRAEFDSIIRLVRSQLDVSVARILRDE